FPHPSKWEHTLSDDGVERPSTSTLNERKTRRAVGRTTHVEGRRLLYISAGRGVDSSILLSQLTSNRARARNKI
ncbi:hypothetical protein PMAYCL1PPCAC_18208, partial [Pristionchus mayeri]